MSKESFTMLQSAGYEILQKLGKQKFIPIFSSMSSRSRSRKKRNKLITKLLTECLEDDRIINRMLRSEDLGRVSLQIQRILNHFEYRYMRGENRLRYTIAQLLVDSDHRNAVEKVLKQNKQHESLRKRPLGKVSNAPDSQSVVDTIFKTYHKAWNAQKGRYHNTKTARCFQAALRDLLSRDWLHSHCILAGYEPIMGSNRLGEVAKIAATTCGCRKFDKFAWKKSFLKKIRKESRSFQYHVVKKIINRSVRKNDMPVDFMDIFIKSHKAYRPGVYTRVFKALKSELLKKEPEYAEKVSEIKIIQDNLKDISRAQISGFEKINVAIKVFAFSHGVPLKFMPARLMTYFEISSAIEHPNVVNFIEAFASVRELFFIMPYAEHKSLNHVINEHGALLKKTAQIWTFQISLALQYLHTAGIVHRNVKCSNILINENYEAILSGLGSAKIIQSDLINFHVTESRNYRVGYTPYRPPEVVIHEPYCMPPVDVWSLGVVMFRMLNNAFPFCYHDKKFMLYQQENKNWTDAWRRSSDDSKQCLHLINKLLEPSPEKRIRIHDLVRHQWFHGLIMPKAHEEAMERAPYIFQSKKNKMKKTKSDVQSTAAQSRLEHDLLDDIYNNMEHIANRLKGANRTFKRLEFYEGHQKCYTKLKRKVLLKKVDQKLRKRRPKRIQEKDPYRLEKYYSDKDESAIYEKVVGDIEELKKDPEEVRKLVEPRHDERKLETMLSKLVGMIKSKMEKLQAREEDVANMIGEPSKVDSEPRSILHMRSFEPLDRKLTIMRRDIFSKTSVRTDSSLGRDSIALKQNWDFSQASSLRTDKGEGIAYPNLEFVAKDDVTDEDYQ